MAPTDSTPRTCFVLVFVTPSPREIAEAGWLMNDPCQMVLVMTADDSCLCKPLVKTDINSSSSPDIVLSVAANGNGAS